MFSDPKKNLEKFHIDPGMKVADLGAGVGNYSLALSELVGSTGRVIAVDVQQNLLSKLKDEAMKLNLDNVEVIWGNIEEDGGTRLADYSVDRVVIANTLFQAEDKKGLVKEAKRILKPNGKLLLIDWVDSFNGLGPSKDDIITVDDAKRIFEDEGYIFEKEMDAGDHHYGLIFKI